MSKASIRILCVDDHPVLVEGLRARMGMESDLQFAGHLPSAENLVAEVKKQKADVVLLDVAMPGPDPFEAAADLHAQCPNVRTVFLSAYVRDHYLDAMFRAGGWGYFSKRDELADILDGIRRVASGEYVLGPKVLDRCRPTKPGKRGSRRQPTSKLKSLTFRETQVLAMIGKGMSREDIAAALHRSVKTVDTHRAAIMKKLDIDDRTELALFAVKEGLVDLE